MGAWVGREKKLTTSLYEELEESEVGQFGAFLPMQKLPYFLPTELRVFSCLTYVDFRILSHSASNFLINQKRKNLSL